VMLAAGAHRTAPGRAGPGDTVTTRTPAGPNS
jgi:hypothetical protein